VLIDWFTVVAQIVNFLILVGLLYYFLYGRILAAIDRREEEIAARWEEAKQEREDAAAEYRRLEKEKEKLDQEREALLARAREEADEHRQELIDQARAETEELKSRWSQSVREESKSFLRDLREYAAREVCDIARSALADLADEELQHQVTRVFLQRLRALDDDEKRKFTASIRDYGEKAVLRSAFAIPGEQQEEITRALRGVLDNSVEIRFEESSDLICGIALHTDGHKLAWEMSDYLEGLERHISETLRSEFAGDESEAEETYQT
jgi:F-type H+-transporting ATPase subunit b